MGFLTLGECSGSMWQTSNFDFKPSFNVHCASSLSSLLRRWCAATFSISLSLSMLTLSMFIIIPLVPVEKVVCCSID